jgi:hypothetical protein
LKLTSIALIAFGTALVASSNAVWHLHTLKHAAMMTGEAEPTPGSEILASEMASGSAGIQALAGLAAGVLSVLALAGTGIDSVILIVVALLALGATMVLTGNTLSGTVLGFMHEEPSQQSYSTRAPSSRFSQPFSGERRPEGPKIAHLRKCAAEHLQLGEALERRKIAHQRQ